MAVLVPLLFAGPFFSESVVMLQDVVPIAIFVSADAIKMMIMVRGLLHELVTAFFDGWLQFFINNDINMYDEEQV